MRNRLDREYLCWRCGTPHGKREPDYRLRSFKDCPTCIVLRSRPEGDDELSRLASYYTP